MKKKIIALCVASTMTASVCLNALAAIDVTENSTLDYHGYMRIGTGFTKDGETQVDFKAPGAETKYRLGNEPDTNIEMALDYRRYMDSSKSNSDKYVQAVIMLEGYDSQGNESNIDLSDVAQAYLSFNNILGAGTNAWIGRRYYDRIDTHMTDHFWLNTAQNSRAAAGIEGVKVGNADFNVALIMSEDDGEFVSGDSVNSTALDLRLKNINTNDGGALNLWAYYNNRPENEGAGLDDEDGFGLGVWHSQKLFDGKGKNTVHMIYRDGTAVSQGDFNPNPLMNDISIEDVNFVEIATDLVTKVNDDWELGFTALYRTTQKDTATGSEDTDWFSIGIRPQYTISEHLSAVFELGHDQVDSDNANGGVTKFTTALQLGAEPGYWARPVLRIFVTVATWDDEFEGQVGGKAFDDDTFGWTAGAQGEWWW
ncbi:MAG: maltoporin [Moritella sp.]|jgi:maltoporin